MFFVLLSFIFFISWFFIAGMCRLLGEVTTAEPSSTSPTNEVENIPEDDIDISSAQMGTYYSLFVVSIELVEERGKLHAFSCIMFDLRRKKVWDSLFI